MKRANIVIGETEKEVKESVIRNVRWQMSSDRKSTPLKSLQGHMWRAGYQNGELRGRYTFFSSLPLLSLPFSFIIFFLFLFLLFPSFSFITIISYCSECMRMWLRHFRSGIR